MSRCRHCDEQIVEKRVFPGSVWATLAEEIVCEVGNIGHEPYPPCTTSYCEDFGEPVESGGICPECGLLPAAATRHD